MQKKNDNILEKIVKKDYNNELEKVLEKKYIDENVKSILLSILYKIEGGYKDYKKVKQNVETKEEFIERIIKIIQKDCDEIKLVNPNSVESKILGNRTFLVEKNKKRIITYNIERKLLYCIAKIGKKEKIIKDNYFVINKTLTNLINTGNNINTVEPLRDFNGYSWTTISSEMESIEHNLIYQNLLMVIGNEFLNKWIYNNEVLIDYMEQFTNKIKENYEEKLGEEFIKNLSGISILLEMKFNSSGKKEIEKLEEEIQEQIEEIQDNERFVEITTMKKKKITSQIKQIDETINNKELLQKEYEKRNNKLALEEKIFSMRILSTIMSKEREEKILEIEKLNELLNPQKFVKYKKELEEKEKVLQIINSKTIEQLKMEIQKTFLKMFEIKIQKAR